MSRLLTMIFLVSGLAACTSVPVYLERPADPSIQVPRIGYRSVTGDTRTYRPVGPKGWEETNRRVGPKP